MPFRIALSGLNAASADLGVTANNIANVNTTGFKGSRAQFGDVFAVSPYGLSRNIIGSGVRMTGVAQQFAQGNIDFTNNSLDLAISGNGFFTLSDGGTLVYSRAGNFNVNRDGNVVNGVGQRLQVYPPASNGVGFDTGSMSDLQLSTNDNPPTATTNVFVTNNLPANATPPAVAVFDPTDANSYNNTTSLTVYDSLGVSHVASLYYVKSATANTWDVYSEIDGNPSGGPDSLAYSDTGALITPVGGQVVIPPYTPTTGAAALNITIDLTKSSQFGSAFTVNELRQDGFAVGQLTGIETSPEGVVYARYSNGQSTGLGQIVLSTFPNSGGLQQLGDTTWGETFESGQALRGQAGSSSLGSVQSGALEASNVNLTEQLVNMITAQRNFQANAQMISTADQVTQTVINIR
jgi:flagellar hook protein FlgE